MKYEKTHITGASGSGTTTVGKVISEKTGFSHFDTDDFFPEQFVLRLSHNLVGGDIVHHYLPPIPVDDRSTVGYGFV
ncbi:MAG: hypothetical protein GY866_28215 [Proteobacteria bacterium]|nr:hypothetical protein [Pseudomonadota bacterium]